MPAVALHVSPLRGDVLLPGAPCHPPPCVGNQKESQSELPFPARGGGRGRGRGGSDRATLPPRPASPAAARCLDFQLTGMFHSTPAGISSWREGVGSIATPRGRYSAGCPGLQRAGREMPQPGVRHNPGSGAAQGPAQPRGLAQPGVQHSPGSGTAQGPAHPGVWHIPGVRHSPGSGTAPARGLARSPPAGLTPACPLLPAGPQGDAGQGRAGGAAAAGRAVLQAPEPAAHHLGARLDPRRAAPSACCRSLSALLEVHVPHAVKRRAPSPKLFVLNLMAVLKPRPSGAPGFALHSPGPRRRCAARPSPGPALSSPFRY